MSTKKMNFHDVVQRAVKSEGGKREVDIAQASDLFSELRRLLQTPDADELRDLLHALTGLVCWTGKDEDTGDDLVIVQVEDLPF